MSEVRIVLPSISNDQISHDLVWLTEHLVKTQGAPTTGGLLGGEFGYGAEFENDTFEMHPFYWGDCTCGFDEADCAWDEENDHRADCYQNVIRERGFLDFEDAPPGMSYNERNRHNERITDFVCAEMGLDPDHGCYVHCTCDYRDNYAAWRAVNDHDPKCGIARPNFLHKPSGTRVDWYKYIGRGMEIEANGDWRTILNECVDSLA